MVWVFGATAVVTYYHDLACEIDGGRSGWPGGTCFVLVNEGGRWLAIHVLHRGYAGTGTVRQIDWTAPVALTCCRNVPGFTVKKTSVCKPLFSDLRSPAVAGSHWTPNVAQPRPIRQSPPGPPPLPP